MSEEETHTSPTTAPAERLDRPVLQLDLNRVAAELKEEKPWQARGHNARTLAKDADLRLVLVALKAGGRLKEHQAEECVSVHALSGRLRLKLPSPVVELTPGQVLVMERGLSHDVEALEESTFLLTVPTPRG